MQSTYELAATVIVVIHAFWIVWVIGGLFIAHMSRSLRTIHTGCALLTLGIMAMRGVCPLTDLEQHYDRLAGKASYQGGFIHHYAAAFVYGDLIPITNSALMIGTMLVTAIALLLRFHDKLKM
jgi:hypothetical protein